MVRSAPRWARARGVAVALAAVAASSGLARAADPTPPPPPSSSPDAATPASDDAARDEAQGAAALRATQQAEARLIEMQRELDALARERASYDDVRARLDVLEAREQALAAGASRDWMSADDGGGAVRFSQDGVVIRSPNDRFLLRPELRLQTIYEGDLAKAGTGDRARPDASTFAFAHAEVLLEGHAVSRRLEYRLELDFADTQAGIAKDAFVQWRFADAFTLRAGQLRVPYGLQTQYWNAYLELVDVAQATSAFTLARDVGVMALGRPLAGRLQYQVAATNGPRGLCPPNDDNLRCDAVDLAYAARIVAAPFGPLPVVEGDVDGQRHPLVAVGVSGAYQLVPTDVRARTGVIDAPLDVDGNGRVDNVSVWQGAAELRAMFRGASVQGEWLARREHPGAGAADRNFWGAYGEASYFVLPHHLQLVGRVGRTDLPLYGATIVERALRGARTTEEGVGLSAYLRGHDAKLQVDYTHLSTPGAMSAPVVDRVRAAVQLAF
ncbi:MAG TPA: porin [Polyangia bacterium]|nr:porin [Polyangia bacterium]